MTSVSLPLLTSVSEANDMAELPSWEIAYLTAGAFTEMDPDQMERAV